MIEWLSVLILYLALACVAIGFAVDYLERLVLRWQDKRKEGNP